MDFVLEFVWVCIFRAIILTYLMSNLMYEDCVGTVPRRALKRDAPLDARRGRKLPRYQGVTFHRWAPFNGEMFYKYVVPTGAR